MFNILRRPVVGQLPTVESLAGISEHTDSLLAGKIPGFKVPGIILESIDASEVNAFVTEAVANYINTGEILTAQVHPDSISERNRPFIQGKVWTGGVDQPGHIDTYFDDQYRSILRDGIDDPFQVPRSNDVARLYTHTTLDGSAAITMGSLKPGELAKVYDRRSTLNKVFDNIRSSERDVGLALAQATDRLRRDGPIDQLAETQVATGDTVIFRSTDYTNLSPTAHLFTTTSATGRSYGRSAIAVENIPDTKN